MRILAVTLSLISIFLISIVSLPTQAQQAQDWGDWKSTPNYPFIQVRVRCDYDSPDGAGTSGWSYQLRNIYAFAVHVTYREEGYGSNNSRNTMSAASLVTLQAGELLKGRDAVLLGTCESLEGMHVMVMKVTRASDDSPLPTLGGSASASVLGKGGKGRGGSSPQAAATGANAAGSAAGKSSETSSGNTSRPSAVAGPPALELGDYECICRSDAALSCTGHQIEFDGNGTGENGNLRWTLSGSSISFVRNDNTPYVDQFQGQLIDRTTFRGEYRELPNRFGRRDVRDNIECKKKKD